MRAWGAPSRSSMELAVLRDVEGRGGGARPELEPGGMGAGPVDAARGNPLAPPGTGTPREPGNPGLPARDGGPAPVDGRLSIDVPRSEIDGGRCNMGGPEAVLPPLTDLLCGIGPFGGGGVARAEAVALFGSFLLTHFLSSGS